MVIEADSNSGLYGFLSTPSHLLLCFGVILVALGVGFRIQIGERGGSVNPNKWASIGAFGLGVGCLVLGVVLLLADTGTTQSPQPTSTGPTSTATSLPSVAPSQTGTAPLATLDFPTAQAGVSKLHGFVASGTAGQIGSLDIWILDFDGAYTVDGVASIAGSKWSAADYPLGDASDALPYPLTLVAVTANAACSATLLKVSNTDEDSIAKLPSGCHVFGQVTVDVDKP